MLLEEEEEEGKLVRGRVLEDVDTVIRTPDTSSLTDIVYTDNRARSFPSRLLKYYLYARGGYAERLPSAPAADKDTLGCNQEKEAKMPKRHIWERLVVESTEERLLKTAAGQICLLFSPHLSSHHVFNRRIKSMHRTANIFRLAQGMVWWEPVLGSGHQTWWLDFHR